MLQCTQQQIETYRSLIPVRSTLRNKPNLTVLVQSVTGVDRVHRQVLRESGPLNDDYLVLALGSVTSYFGHSEWESHAPGLKSLDDALRIRRQILLAFERAENSLSETEKARLVCVVSDTAPYRHAPF